ncbi:class I SAM-dependent methyltransferase [Streptomyces sp. NPDC015130]|uniref:class I SAM-dependent methyltransferase n=1 Tax=Streptomyces sp. NPDC015130 TaxID=3364940 RepID=UPI0036FE6EE9
MSEPIHRLRQVAGGAVPDSADDPVRITFTGVAETLLAPLYARALDARSPHPLLADLAAAELVARTDYEFGRLGINETNAVGVALRTLWFDRQVRRFLAAHPAATVVHLGCGLDDRYTRLGPGPRVAWYDLDRPEVIDLHRRVHPEHPRRHTLAASVTDPDWPERIPTDRPVLVVAEGLSMYLKAEEGPRALRRIVARFPYGELVLDTYSRFAVGSTRRFALFRRTGAQLAWGVDHPRELPAQVAGLRLVGSVSAYGTAKGVDLSGLPAKLRARMLVDTQIMARLPVLGSVGHLSRHSFGVPRRG